MTPEYLQGAPVVSPSADRVVELSDLELATIGGGIGDPIAA